MQLFTTSIHHFHSAYSSRFRPLKLYLTRRLHRRGGVVWSEAEDEDISYPIKQTEKVSKVDSDPQKIGAQLEQIGRDVVTAERRAQERIDADLYSDNWSGDVYVGSQWNLLTVLLLISVLVPIGGLLFAYLTYGKLWGVESLY